MTECYMRNRCRLSKLEFYRNPFLDSFAEKGANALLEVPGLAMDEWTEISTTITLSGRGKNPTIVEIRDLDNANSEHSRTAILKGNRLSMTL